MTCETQNSVSTKVSTKVVQRESVNSANSGGGHIDIRQSLSVDIIDTTEVLYRDRLKGMQVLLSNS